MPQEHLLLTQTLEQELPHVVSAANIREASETSELPQPLHLGGRGGAKGAVELVSIGNVPAPIRGTS